MSLMEWLGYLVGMAITFVIAATILLSLISLAAAIVVGPFFAIRSIRHWRRRGQEPARASNHALLQAEVIKEYVEYEENLRRAGKYRWEQPPGGPTKELGYREREGHRDSEALAAYRKVNPDYLRPLDNKWLPRGPS